MQGFRYRHNSYVAKIGELERKILASLVADVGLLLGSDFAGSLRGDDDAHSPWQARDGAGSDADDLERLFNTEPDAPAREELIAIDPAFGRLFPAAHAEDGEVAAEFHRLSFGGLLAGKVERLRMVWADLIAPGDKLVIHPDRAMDWAAALTDVRLVLADRLQLQTQADTEELDERMAGDEATAAMGSVYYLVSWLQESLVTVMTSRL